MLGEGRGLKFKQTQWMRTKSSTAVNTHRSRCIYSVRSSHLLLHRGAGGALSIFLYSQSLGFSLTHWLCDHIFTVRARASVHIYESDFNERVFKSEMYAVLIGISVVGFPSSFYFFFCLCVPLCVSCLCLLPRSLSFSMRTHTCGYVCPGFRPFTTLPAQRSVFLFFFVALVSCSTTKHIDDLSSSTRFFLLL